MKLSRILAAILITASAALAQSPQNWFPGEIEALGQNASSRTEFSLDHNMVVLASKADQDDESLRRVIAGVDGISVHRFRFPAQGMYDPRILNAVRQDYQRAGWQHIADAHDKYGYPQATDLWLHFDHNTIRNIAVMFTGRDTVNFVSVSGSISPVDLMHLAGHFGIPRMEGGVVVSSSRTAPYGSAPPPNAAGPPPTENGQDNAPPQRDDDYRHPNPAPGANSSEQRP